MPNILCNLKSTFLIRKQILFQRPKKQSKFSTFVSIEPFYNRFLKKYIALEQISGNHSQLSQKN